MEWMNEIPIQEARQSVGRKEDCLRKRGQVYEPAGERARFCSPFQPAFSEALILFIKMILVEGIDKIVSYPDNSML